MTPAGDFELIVLNNTPRVSRRNVAESSVAPLEKEAGSARAVPVDIVDAITVAGPQSIALIAPPEH